VSRLHGEVKFGVLGPLEVRVAGRPVAVPGARQRALLAALLLRRGSVVPFDRLVDEVFGEQPPEEARNALQTYIARLRHALGPAAAGVVVTRAPGYVLEVPGGAVDVERFCAQLVRAREAESPTAALALLEQALALWRGTPYGEFAATFARGEALRLQELWLAAREDRAALLVRLGRLAEATAALEAIVAEEPWRERAVELLVSALAEAGRAGHALAAYGRYREQLRDELGLDPSPKLRRLQEQVLRGEVQPVQPRPAGRDRGALPTRATSFVGREQQLALIRKTLAGGRLVTLIGPGGVGKTRLAQQAAAAEGPVWWVDLAPLRDASAVPQALADALDLDVQPGTPLLDSLREWARGAGGLLVVDNCEHLLAAAAGLLQDLLAVSSALRLLATSRQRLGVDGEQVLVVPPLAVPAPDAEEVPTPAVWLFCDRARAADPDFAPGREVLRRVGEVCRALDGLPLAIELAAARIGTLTVDDLAERLDARFQLLGAGRRGGDARHHTLGGVVDWSFDLLTPEEQRLFLRLSVFAAAFDIGAAEAVVADDDLPVGRVADLLAGLADQSMLTRPGHTGVGRYRMLETLRAYAAARLPATEADQLRHRHAAFMLDVAERADAGLYGPEEPAWARRVETWLDDLRAAWGWARDASQVDLAVRLAAALTRYGYWRVRPDILAWGAWAAAVPAHPRLAVAHAAAAHAAWIDGRLDPARELAQRGVAIAGGPTAPGAAAPLEALGDAALLSGDLAAALEAYRGVAALAAPGDLAGLAIATANQALVLSYGGDEQAASATASQAVAAALASANPTAIAMARFAEGEALADVDPTAAAAALEEARRGAQEVGNRYVAGTALTASVALRSRHGPPDPALALFRDAVKHWQSTGNRGLIVTTLRNLVILLARTGRDEAAVTLAATLQVQAPRRSYGKEAERIATALAAVRQRLGDAAYAHAWAAGASKTLDEAAEAAVRLLDSGPGVE
jgi:predicted ATPase/DNA-binding SARP family transcriptional activator